MLKIDLLGKLTLRRNGETLELPQSKKTRALLAYLVLTGRAHRRERLVSMFWDVPDDPRGALRWSLTKLRGLVDEPGQKRIKADRETVAFDRADTDVDLLRLRELLEGGAEHVSTDELEAAAQAVRGPALEGLELHDSPEYYAWFLAEQEEANVLVAELHRTLIGRYGDAPERALEQARALVAFQPYDSEARSTLIDLLKKCGRRQEAEAQHREALRILEEVGAPAELPDVESAAEGQDTAVLDRPTTAPPAGAPSAKADADTRAMMRRPAVAVLPFENISGDPEQDYLAIGITDDVITALSCWRWFPVIARTSIFAYEGKHKDVVSIGRELGARYVVQGSLRRGGNRVRVVAQLVDAERGTSIWAQRYDRDLEDIFDLQQEISDQIAAHIEPELARAEHGRVESRPIGDLKAWDLNIRAVTHILRGTPADLEQATQLLEESQKRNPDSSYTHSLRAFVMYHQALLVWMEDDPAARARSYLETARKSVELDESNWLGHALLGMALLWGRRDYEQAAEEERRAVELNPTAALAHQFMGCVRNLDGNPDRAIPHLEAALRLNPGPTSATLLLADLSLSHLLLRDFARAENYARQAISKREGNTRALERLAAALGHQGRDKEARAVLEGLIGRQGPLRRAYLEMTYPFRTEAHRDLLWDGLRRAGWDG